MSKSIKAGKWYYLTLGYGGSESRYVAAVRMTGKTTGGAGMFSLFGNKDGSTMRPLPVGAVVTGIDGERVTFAEPSTPEDRGTVFGVGVTVSENPGKNGIEIRFAAKPPDATLDALKVAGWRWSRFSRCWYTRASDDARTFAERIAAEG